MGWLESADEKILAKIAALSTQIKEVDNDTDDLQVKVKALQASVDAANKKLDTILAAVSPGPAIGFSVKEK